MEKCCICTKQIEREDPAVLAMGGAGIPRYLCDECENLLDTATLSHNHEEAGVAIGKLSKMMAENDPDRVTYTIVSDLLLKASDRAVAIKEGSYDFSLDEQHAEEEGFDDIPEDLQETEEDKEKDRIDEEKQKQFDKFFNYAVIGACIAFVGLLIWKIIETFFLNK